MAQRVQGLEADRVGAHAIKFVRELQGIDRDTFAAMLTEKTGEEWTRSMVVNLENGRKLVTLGVLSAVSEILDRDPSFFLYGGAGSVKSRNPGSHITAGQAAFSDVDGALVAA